MARKNIEGAAAARRRAAAHAPPAWVARAERIGRNLVWSWDGDGARLFAMVDPVQWEATRHNPILTLRSASPTRLEMLSTDAQFQRLLTLVEKQLADYLKAPRWFLRTVRGRDRKMLVAYFSAEYSVHESMQQYSGGLGVLAGDHLKTASDLGVPLVGVGLLYRSGYYRQSLGVDGRTLVEYPRYDFDAMPIGGTERRIRVPLGSATLHARVWHMQVGRTPLLLLDADVPENPPRLREVTARLYGGDTEMRIQQEILLGMGGVLALQACSMAPTVYHLNEGHAAFGVLERLQQLRRRRVNLADAMQQVRQSTVFTTHTPVPAGHDRFDAPLMMKYFAPFVKNVGLTRDQFLGLGREDPADRREPFCMTVLALRMADRCNGVAALHGDTSRRMWTRVYRAAVPEEVPIKHVTNGVHSPTWIAPPTAALYRKHLKPRWNAVTPASDWWAGADRIPPAELWALRGELRIRLVQFARARVRQQMQRRGASAEELQGALHALDERTLTLGFARRFATYKRAPLIFTDPRRLAAILNNPARPMQLVFAGKAHPKDEGGQAFAQLIYKFTQSPPFRGRVVLLEEYDMQVGQMMTAGCDVWLNTPLRPHEASGTSGMKPPLQGGLNCSILDGWWPESYNGENGWAIGDETQLSDRKKQDKRDAEALYTLLEQQIGPLFYERGADGVPAGWAQRMAASMKTVSAAFSAYRMLGEYTRDYYLPAHREG